MKLARHLSYANVIATLALFVALGGGAYALSNNSVKSKQIRNNTIKSVDVKDRSGPGKRSGLKAKDIQFDSLGGEEIREDTLNVREFLRLGDVGGGPTCALTGTLVTCGEARVNVPKKNGDVLVIATGGYESAGGVPARAFCKVQLDGVETGATANPGEATSDNTSGAAYESFTMIGKASGVSKGFHDLRLLCLESGGDAEINSPTIIGLALGTGPWVRWLHGASMQPRTPLIPSRARRAVARARPAHPDRGPDAVGARLRRFTTENIRAAAGPRMSASEPINIADLERLAAELLEPGPHGYFAGGAGDERTLRANVEAFSRWELRPRVLVDVSEVSTAIEILGRGSSMPLLVAPMAFQAMAHGDGEPGMARAAAAAGTVICVSTFATVGPAEVAAAAPGGRRWLQVYWLRDFEIVKGILAEAREAGYEAIVLTVDAPYAGRRERDLRNEFAIPAELGVPALEAAVGSRNLTIEEVLGFVDPSVTWSDLERLVAEAELPVFIKGVMTAEDGRLAVEHGVAGVVVSNHGGRQLDGVSATLDALPEVVEAVDGRIEVLMDGGIRRGTHAAVALALGADAVLVGRPILWGLAVDGQAGAELALRMLRDELELALALLGCTAPSELSETHVRRAN